MKRVGGGGDATAALGLRLLQLPAAGRLHDRSRVASVDRRVPADYHRYGMG